MYHRTSGLFTYCCNTAKCYVSKTQAARGWHVTVRCILRCPRPTVTIWYQKKHFVNVSISQWLSLWATIDSSMVRTWDQETGRAKQRNAWSETCEPLRQKWTWHRNVTQVKAAWNISQITRFAKGNWMMREILYNITVVTFSSKLLWSYNKLSSFVICGQWVDKQLWIWSLVRKTLRISVLSVANINSIELCIKPYVVAFFMGMFVHFN